MLKIKRLWKASLTLAVLFYGFPGSPQAQPPRQNPGPERQLEPEHYSLFLERTYVQLVPYKYFENNEPSDRFSKHAGLPYLFEASVSPHLFIYENYQDALRRDNRKLRTAFDVTFTPRIDLRMYSTGSVPVRRPSFKPFLNFNHSWFVKSDTSALRDKVWIHNFMARFIHYSDGAEGCLFREQTRTVEKGDLGLLSSSCSAIDEDQLDTYTVNTLDGEYSSTYLVFGYHLRRLETDSKGTETHHWMAGMEMEWHPGFEWWRKNMFGAETDLQRKIYDRTLMLTFKGEMGHPLKFATLNYSLKVDYFPYMHGVNKDLGAWVAPYYAQGRVAAFFNTERLFQSWGVFVGAGAGQDYQNVDFRRQIFQVNLGLIKKDPFAFKILNN